MAVDTRTPYGHKERAGLHLPGIEAQVLNLHLIIPAQVHSFQFRYDFLQYQDTVDDDILENVQVKAERMSEIIDQDYAIYSLDMFAEDEELQAYDRLFGTTR